MATNGRTATDEYFVATAAPETKPAISVLRRLGHSIQRPRW